MRQTAVASLINQNRAARKLDPRIKLVLLLAFLVSLALIRHPSVLQLGIGLASLLLVAVVSHIPLVRLLRASLLVIPFVGIFAIAVYFSGDSQRAVIILCKAYLSALSVLITTSCTSLPELVGAAVFFHAPLLLTEVTQLIYRYLFVLSSEARVMQIAFQSRSGRPGLIALQAASGMIAVLFGRSYRKATVVHHAMEARGYSGVLPGTRFSRLAFRDFAILGLGLLFTVGWHFA